MLSLELVRKRYCSYWLQFENVSQGVDQDIAIIFVSPNGKGSSTKLCKLVFDLSVNHRHTNYFFVGHLKQQC